MINEKLNVPSKLKYKLDHQIDQQSPPYNNPIKHFHNSSRGIGDLAESILIAIVTDPKPTPFLVVSDNAEGSEPVHKFVKRKIKKQREPCSTYQDSN